MERAHDLDKAYLKDVMKLVVESKRREGKKLDIYRVPDNIDQIITKLKQEDERLENDDQDNAEQTDANKQQSKQVMEVLHTTNYIIEPPQNELSVPQSQSEQVPTVMQSDTVIDNIENNVVIYSIEDKPNSDIDLDKCYIFLGNA